MTDLILANEPMIRMGFFIGVLLAMGLWEAAAPRRVREIPRLVRWTNNLAIVVIDTLLVRVAFPVVAVGLALVAQERGWGLFNVIEVPFWPAFVVSLLALPLAIYLQPVMFHAVPAFWRLPRMHLADLEFTLTPVLRFHPFQILLPLHNNL